MLRFSSIALLLFGTHGINKGFKIPYYMHIQEQKQKKPKDKKQIKYKKGEKRKKLR